MITCLYCGYKCPAQATICPNCGKPLPAKSSKKGDESSTAAIKAALKREKAAAQNQVPTAHKLARQNMLVLPGVMIVTLLIYWFFLR